MKVMVLVKATKESESGAMPSERILGEMGKFNEDLVKAGILLSAEGLHPSSKGVRVRFSGKNRTVVDGPFTETKELVAGFWLWQVKSMDEAIEWVRRCPNPFDGESEIEIRRVFAPEDFGEVLTPEIQERDQRLRTEIVAYTLEPPRFENGKELSIAGFNASYTFENAGKHSRAVDALRTAYRQNSWTGRNHGVRCLLELQAGRRFRLSIGRRSRQRRRPAQRIQPHPSFPAALCGLHAPQTCVVDRRNAGSNLEEVAAEFRPAGCRSPEL